MQESILVHDTACADGNRAQYLLVALAVSLMLAWSLLTLVEIPRYLHDPSIPSWQPAALLLCSIFTVLAGLIAWIRSGPLAERALLASMAGPVDGVAAFNMKVAPLKLKSGH